MKSWPPTISSTDCVSYPSVGPRGGRPANGVRFAARGTTLSQADCLIAAAAYATAAVLATGNPRHFPMTEIEVEHWPVGE